MFSSRLHWDLHPNRLAEALHQQREAGASILDLTESNPTRAGFSYPAAQILAAGQDPRALLYDPAPAGSLEARAAVADYYAARGLPVSAQRILLTASTSEAYAHLFKLLADPGDEVLVPCPSYPLFDYLAALESVRVMPYPLVYHHGWSLDRDALARAVTGRTRAVVLVNPNNPTGSFLQADDLGFLIALCRERDLAIISDEVFADFAFGPDPGRVPSLVSVGQVLTFCLSGLSKVAALPQVKLGWIVIGGPEAARAAAGERLELIADTYLSVSTPVQHAAARLLATAPGMQAQMNARLRANLDHLRRSVPADSPCRVLEVEGGWYATLQVPRVRTEEEWCVELVCEDGVLVQPGFFYDFDAEAFLILSLLTRPETFREGLRRILARANRLSGCGC